MSQGTEIQGSHARRRPGAAWLALALFAGVNSGQERLSQALQELSADQASVREGAERYLSGHVGVPDFPQLARAVAAGDEEVSARLARVIGSSDQNLELAGLFMAEDDAALQEVGDEALQRRLAHWNERLSAPGLVGAELRERLFDLSQSSYPYAVRIEFGGSLVGHCSALQRELGLPVGITIAAQLFDRDPIREVQARFQGDWLSALFVLVRIYGVGLELHGVPRRENEEDKLEQRSGAFLRVAPLSELGSRTGLQHMVEWFRTLAASNDDNARRRAAHNLARSGWPGALTWMQERAVSLADAAAWEGLLIAAAHGRRVPTLLRPASLALLLRRVEAQLGSRDPAGHETLEMLLAAFRDAGCLGADLGEKGGELTGVLFENWDTLAPASKALRLALLESLGCGDLEGLAQARSVVADADAPSALRWQALSTAIQVASVRGVIAAPPECPQAERLLQSFDHPQALAVGVQGLVKAGIQPDARWAELSPAARSLTNGAKAGMLLWWYGVGEPSIAALYLLELIDSEESRLALEALRHFEGPGETALAGLFDAAHELASRRSRERSTGRSPERSSGDPLLGFELDRAEAMLGLISPEAFMNGLSSAERDEYLDPKDYPLYGAMGAFGPTPASFEARAHLLSELKEALGRGGDPRRYGRLVGALEELLRGLFRRGQDAIAASIREEIAQITARSPDTGLAQALTRGWPPPSSRHLRILASSPAGARIRALSQGASENGR